MYGVYGVFWIVGGEGVDYCVVFGQDFSYVVFEWECQQLVVVDLCFDFQDDLLDVGVVGQFGQCGVKGFVGVEEVVLVVFVYVLCLLFEYDVQFVDVFGCYVFGSFFDDGDFQCVMYEYGFFQCVEWNV